MAYGDRKPFTMSSGHIRLYEPEHPLADQWGHVMEHRKVAWDAGILTSREQHVHHVNGDPSDNRPGNLQALSHSEHAAEHGRRRKLTPDQRRAKDRARYWRRHEVRICHVCGRRYARVGTTTVDPRGCSNECRAVLRRRDGWRPAYRHLCEVCGKEFRCRVGAGRACSATCRAEVRRRDK